MMARNQQKPGKIIETASRKKMKQHKTIVVEDVAIQFYQKITGGVKDVRFDTNPELAMKQPPRDCSAQRDLTATTSLPQVSLLENSQPNLILELTACSTPGTTPKIEKKRNTVYCNYCGKCNIQRGSKIDNDDGSVWIWIQHLFLFALSSSQLFLL